MGFFPLFLCQRQFIVGSCGREKRGVPLLKQNDTTVSVSRLTFLPTSRIERTTCMYRQTTIRFLILRFFFKHVDSPLVRLFASSLFFFRGRTAVHPQHLQDARACGQGQKWRSRRGFPSALPSSNDGWQQPREGQRQKGRGRNRVNRISGWRGRRKRGWQTICHNHGRGAVVAKIPKRKRKSHPCDRCDV